MRPQPMACRGLGFVSLAMWALIDRLGAPEGARLALYGIVGIGFPILMVLLLASRLHEYHARPCPSGTPS